MSFRAMPWLMAGSPSPTSADNAHPERVLTVIGMKCGL
jgi:hypothetical protein